MIDDSSRSDDSSLEKPVTPIVPNDDSDSQASSNKRYVLNTMKNFVSKLKVFFIFNCRSLDCESLESQITATETSEPGTKKCKITEE